MRSGSGCGTEVLLQAANRGHCQPPALIYDEGQGERRGNSMLIHIRKNISGVDIMQHYNILYHSLRRFLTSVTRVTRARKILACYLPHL